MCLYLLWRGAFRGIFGIRYPLQMLPLLLFELVWKSIWVLAIGLPLWSAGRLDADTRETWNACLMGLVLFPLVIPWGYVWRRYVRQPGDRWGLAPSAAMRPGDARESSASPAT